MKRVFLVWTIMLTSLFGYGENFHSLEASFTQITYQGKEKIIYRGKLFAKKPSLAKWVYESPLKKEIYLNANRVIIYEPILEQATFSTLKESADFFSILKKVQKNDQNQYIAEINQTIYQLELKNEKPYKISFSDEWGNLVEITLHQIKINLLMPDTQFDFKVPAGTDIIQQ